MMIPLLPLLFFAVYTGAEYISDKRKERKIDAELDDMIGELDGMREEFESRGRYGDAAECRNLMELADDRDPFYTQENNELGKFRLKFSALKDKYFRVVGR